MIDWDKARREVPAREIVRAMDYALGMEPLPCQHFLEAYRAIAPVTPDQLHEAAEWFSYLEVHNSLWGIEQLLMHDSQRVQEPVDDRPFQSFADRWAQASLT